MAIAALHPFHLWTDEWLKERLDWKPERPAYLLLIRAYAFREAWGIPHRATYRGYRSWILLQEDCSHLPESVPVLTDSTYQETVAAIRRVIEV
jgi:hypothetical protein